MNIHLAADHAGFAIKEIIKTKLLHQGHTIIDHGALQLNSEDDYPDIMIPCAEAISRELGSFAIICGGSGQGEHMIANKVPHVRAIEYYGGNLEIIRLAREHNHANILSLGARFLESDEALLAVNLFLSTPFSHEERHMRRLEKINQWEQKIFNL